LRVARDALQAWRFRAPGTTTPGHTSGLGLQASGRRSTNKEFEQGIRMRMLGRRLAAWGGGGCFFNLAAARAVRRCEQTANEDPVARKERLAVVVWSSD